MTAPVAMTRIDDLISRAVRDLRDLECAFALVGGLAVSARAEPRFTRDIDVALSVASDEAVEQERANRLATARLLPRGEDEDGVYLDLLFASSGIEPEVVEAATELDILPGVVIPVAATGHLLALKVLSRDDDERPQDIADIRALLRVADEAELDRARAAAALIEERGFHRGRELVRDLDALTGHSPAAN